MLLNEIFKSKSAKAKEAFRVKEEERAQKRRAHERAKLSRNNVGPIDDGTPRSGLGAGSKGVTK